MTAKQKKKLLVRSNRPHAISFKNEQKITRDSFRDECDVNKIVENFMATGQLLHTNRLEPQYGDAPDIDFFDAACVHAEIASAEAEGKFAPETASEDAEAPSEDVTPSDGESEEKALPEPSTAPEESSG